MKSFILFPSSTSTLKPEHVHTNLAKKLSSHIERESRHAECHTFSIHSTVSMLNYQPAHPSSGDMRCERHKQSLHFRHKGKSSLSCACITSELQSLYAEHICSWGDCGGGGEKLNNSFEKHDIKEILGAFLLIFAQCEQHTAHNHYFTSTCHAPLHKTWYLLSFSIPKNSPLFAMKFM